jgi:hypothetical protein
MHCPLNPAFLLTTGLDPVVHADASRREWRRTLRLASAWIAEVERGNDEKRDVPRRALAPELCQAMHTVIARSICDEAIQRETSHWIASLHFVALAMTN